MLGQTIVSWKDGEAFDGQGKKLSPSPYQPPIEVKKLFERAQRDFQTAYMLQRKPLEEFDGYSLLERARLDQQTFAAYVGLQFEPAHKKWRYKGRKNTARNKLIGILAHMIAGMLFPFVFAQNERDEEDKIVAQAMRILMEERLRRCGPNEEGYEIKFFYMVLCALVNPAVFVGVEYVEALQLVRNRLKNGEIELKTAVNEALSGLMLHIIPIDEILLGDFWSGTGRISAQPFIFRQRRISYDAARGIYSNKFYFQGKDLFDFVEAGRTRWIDGTEKSTLYDVEWSDADGNFVQELTAYYLHDDLELTWVGGVGMFDHEKPYANPFKHRRFAFSNGEWLSMPHYPFAMSGFEPIDPSGRFAYYKSGAFKEYWEDQKINKLDRMLIDGIALDVFKPLFLSGVAKVDGTVMAPGSTVAMPAGAQVTPYSLSPNVAAAYQAIQKGEEDMAQSTQDKVMQGITEKGITATQTIEAKQNARIFLGVFGFMIAHLVKQVGELVMDCIIMHDTIGELDEYAHGALRLKYKTFLAKGKEKGRNITHRIYFSDRFMGKSMTEKQKEDFEWDLYEKAGGYESDQRIWMINPYKFARTRYSVYIDADQIVMKSIGIDRIEKERAFEKLMDPRVLPFIDPEAVVTDFVIDEYSDGDPERYKRKGRQDDVLQSILGQAQNWRERSRLPDQYQTTT